MARKKQKSTEELASAQDFKPDALDVDASSTCPVCKSDLFINPSMKLLVSPCYHRVCEPCVERLFAHGTAPCPVCGVALRRSNFNVPFFEDLAVEKECRIRKRISTVFNKREEDFETLRDYNDYLEEVEGIIFNLVNDMDVQKTNDMLEAYRSQNLDQIVRNKQLAEREDEQLRRTQREEEQRRLDYESMLLAELEEEEQRKQREESQFIEHLASAGPSRRATTTTTRAVHSEAKRKAQEAAIQEMPTLKGLLINREKKETSSGFDPLEGLTQITLPLTFCYNVDQFELWWLGSSSTGSKPLPSETVLLAGGVKAMDIAQQLLLSLCIY